jgi:Arc/MetJ-type ribon-helix-helix transcriptional regulator
MSIDVTDEIQQIIDRAMKTGLYDRPEDVVSAALRSLAEDWDDLSCVAEREGEPRTSLADIEAELRRDGLLA